MTNETSNIECDATFDVDLPPEAVWRLLLGLRTERASGDDWWLPGFACPCAEVSAIPERELVVRKGEEPCKDTTIALTLEHTPTGTTIRVVQSGFDPNFVAFAGEGFWIHADHIFADFGLFFAAGGVVVDRAWLPWTMPGFNAETTAGGISVTDVAPDTWAARIGLQTGDIILTVAGVPIFTMADNAVLARMLTTGVETTATWVRSGAVHSGTELV